MTTFLLDQHALALVDTKDATTYVSSPVILIVTNPTKRRYYVHVNLLAGFSGYFDTLSRPHCIEGQKIAVDLETDDGVIFECLVAWLYGKAFKYEVNGSQNPSATAIDIYKLARKFDMPVLENEIVDKIREHLRTTQTNLSPSSIVIMYKHGLLGSQIGQLIVESFAWSLTREPGGIWSGGAQGDEARERNESAKEVYDIPEVAAVVLKCIATHSGSSWHNPIRVTGCAFHVHEDGENCQQHEGEHEARLIKVES